MNRKKYAMCVSLMPACRHKINILIGKGKEDAYHLLFLCLLYNLYTMIVFLDKLQSCGHLSLHQHENIQ